MASTTSAAVAAFKKIEGSQTKKLENTTKRDFLIDLEKKYQKEWKDARLFEVNAPSSEDTSLANLSGEELRQKYPKFFGTFPYPYMNGSLHLGHGFTISKIEFASGFERMLGKRALFPVGFHCTGMPIKAAADKLIREMEMFGSDFENFKDEEVDVDEVLVKEGAPVAMQPASNQDASAPSTSTSTSNVDKSKKSKVNAKSTGLTYQFQIMESIGIARADIKKFADPLHWIEYFPPIATADLTAFGARVDWRRSFITTDKNPYYDSFVRWQINRLREMEYIKFGKRHTIYSPKDGQPCMDHDRQTGEAVGPQEYTALKMEVVSWAPSAQDIGQKTSGKKVYMVAATLRPETMYGQTNCYVGTNITYGIYAAAGGDSYYLVTERAARNMAFQDQLLERGKYDKVAEIKGSNLIGTKIKAPNGVNPEVYVLPMDGVLANKGTGVVTSVPSDSPDDYATLMDLRKKPEYYKIDPAWAALDPVPVLSTPEYGDMSAPFLCKELKISSQKDKKQLEEAKDRAYKAGFNFGVMTIGKYKGEAVSTAKPKVRQDMIDDGLAFDYQEPASQVMSRSADECVVALVDQWYMDYGSDAWKPKAQKLLAQMNTYNQVTRNAFDGVMDWLHQWACARTYGLGSKMPFDKTQLVESLSDSTIYMAYYTVAHLLQGGVIDGSQTGPLGVKPEDLTDETWDYIFGRADFPKNTGITKEQGEALRREYTYFYPMDIRSSGKDLIPNHLSFCIYVHSALFPESMWPRSMRANGHLLLNGKKMSKSTGNSLTLNDSIAKFGADASRLALANAGDGVDDANFEEDDANKLILRLHTLIEFGNELLTPEAELRDGEKNFWDIAFESKMNDAIVRTKEMYTDARYKDAVKLGFYDFQIARDEYKLITGSDVGMHRELVFNWLRNQALMILPIAPHFAEHIWKAILKEEGSVQNARYPEPSASVDRAAIEASDYLRSLLDNIRSAEANAAKKKAKGKGVGGFDPSKPKGIRIFVARDFPAWQESCIEVLKEQFQASTSNIQMADVKVALAGKGLLKEKRAMPFCVEFTNRIKIHGAQIFDRKLPYDELATVENAMPYFKKQMRTHDISVETIDVALAAAKELGSEAAAKGYETRVIEAAEPGDPRIVFYNV